MGHTRNLQYDKANELGERKGLSYVSARKCTKRYVQLYGDARQIEKIYVKLGRLFASFNYNRRGGREVFRGWVLCHFVERSGSKNFGA